jgi:hypothetical protein
LQTPSQLQAQGEQKQPQTDVPTRTHVHGGVST